MKVEIIRVSAKGQISLPADIRKSLSISDGDALAAFATDKAIVLRPIKLPTEEEFSGWLEEAQAWAREAGYTEEDLGGVIKSVRIKNRNGKRKRK
jgi:AbrB family looped-hinge helix DNA binding protein